MCQASELVSPQADIDEIAVDAHRQPAEQRNSLLVGPGLAGVVEEILAVRGEGSGPQRGGDLVALVGVIRQRRQFTAGGRRRVRRWPTIV
jgi:hypothetical protein